MYYVIGIMRSICAFMWRDVYVYGKDIRTHAINYVFLYPLVLGICFAYLQKNIYFGADEIEKGTILFLGTITTPLLLLAFKAVIELLLDLEGNRFINYQLTIVPAPLIIIQRIFFASLYTFFLAVPYLPMVKLFLGNHLATGNALWPPFVCLMYASSLCCASYTMLAIILLSVKTLGSFWIRVNWVLMNLGGFFVPLAVIQKSYPWIQCIAYANPLLYIMEGTRSAILGTNQFISVYWCIPILLLFSVAFTALSCRFFKKRVDHL
jgi:ABC-2 type transport system permease protein